MTLNTTVYGDNPFAPGVSQDTYIPDQLIAGDFKLVTMPIVAVGGPYARGTVLGEISQQPISAISGTNTGNGTVGSLAATTGFKVGNYALLATGATTFSVTDPEGNVLANATVGTAYNQGGVQFTITAGGTAFVAGDSFTLNIEAGGVGQFKLSVATASDGSQIPSCILVDATDLTTPVNTDGYFTGEFNARAVVFDPSWTSHTLRNALAARSIFLKSSVSAADPT